MWEWLWRIRQIEKYLLQQSRIWASLFLFVSRKILHDPMGMKTPAENLLQGPWHPSFNESQVWTGAEVLSSTSVLFCARCHIPKQSKQTLLWRGWAQTGACCKLLVPDPRATRQHLWGCRNRNLLYHRITVLGETLKIIWFQPSCHGVGDRNTSHRSRLAPIPCPCSGSSTALPVTSTPAQPPRQELQILPVCTGFALIPLKPLQASGGGSQRLQTTALICDSLPWQSAGRERSRGGPDRLLWPQRPRRTCWRLWIDLQTAPGVPLQQIAQLGVPFIYV